MDVFETIFLLFFISETLFSSIYTSFLYHTEIFKLDAIKNEKNEDNNKKMPIYSATTKQNANNCRFWIKKNKCIA